MAKLELPGDNQLTAEELELLDRETKKWWAKMQYVTPRDLEPEKLIIAGFRQGWRNRHRMAKEGWDGKIG